MNALTVILFFMFGVIILVIAQRFTKKTSRGSGQDNLKKLLSKTMGDKSLAERLIERERMTNPNLQRAALINAAIARWERDNR
jgi:hypothetical protein